MHQVSFSCLLFHQFVSFAGFLYAAQFSQIVLQSKDPCEPGQIQDAQEARHYLFMPSLNSFLKII